VIGGCRAESALLSSGVPDKTGNSSGSLTCEGWDRRSDMSPEGCEMWMSVNFCEYLGLEDDYRNRNRNGNREYQNP
jgi:hypothetical protein